MDVATATELLLKHYPRIYFACHTRHVRDPKTEQVLSAHQASILDHLDAVEPTLVKDLAAHMGVTPSTISIALDRLALGGFIQRRRDEEDSRKVGVVLTPAGVRIRQANSVLDKRLVRELFQQLDPATRQRAIDGLALLAESAAKMKHDARHRSSR